MSSPSISSVFLKLFSLFSPSQRVVLARVLGLALISAVLELITANLLIIFAQALIVPNSVNRILAKIKLGAFSLTQMEALLYVTFCVGTAFLLKNVFSAFEIFYQNKSIQRLKCEFQESLFLHISDIKYTEFVKKNSAYYANLILSSCDHAFAAINTLTITVSETTVLGVLIGLIIYINPEVAIGAGILFFVIGFLVTKFVFPRFYEWGSRLQSLSINGVQSIYQFFHGFKEVLLSNNRAYFMNSFLSLSRERAKVSAVQNSLLSIPRLILETLFVLAFSIVVVMCVSDSSTEQLLGALSVYFYAGFRMMPGINRLITQLNYIKSNIASIELVITEKTAKHTREIYEENANFSFAKCIDVHKLNFRYSRTSKSALEEVTFSIKKGEIIGIAGETGSGKSTLVDCLLGLVTPTEGKVLIDKKFTPKSVQWRRKIGYVPQAIYLTDNTIAANIAFGEEVVDMAKVKKIVASAQLNKLIDSLPKGLETIVGERGARLSGGERQRIAIARALYHDPEVIIFDEATSALDNETESRIMDTMYELGKTRTLIMIAHRLSTLSRCDRIINLVDGRVNFIESKKLAK